MRSICIGFTVQLPVILDDISLNVKQRMYFQYNGALLHFNRMVRNFLSNHFPNWWIGCGGPHNWLNRSHDLNLLDYCLWRWIKCLIYPTKVQTEKALIDCIFNAAASYATFYAICHSTSQKKLAVDFLTIMVKSFLIFNT